MPKNEEPPAKVSKVDHEEDTALSDTTEVSNLTECSDVPDNMNTPEPSEMADTVMPVVNMPIITEDMPIITDNMPVLTDMPVITDDNPVTDDMPSVTDMLVASAMSAVDMPDTVHRPETAEIPDTAEISQTGDMPETGELPELSDIPDTAEITENTELHTDITEIPETAEITNTAEIPESTDIPDAVEMAEGTESTEMVEERLQESMESQEGHESHEGQEEWLSEGVLTDDDYNPVAEVPEQSDSQATHMESSQESFSNIEESVQVNINSMPEAIVSKPMEQNIEDALNTLEGGPEKEDNLPDDLDAFLIKKSNGKSLTDVKTDNVKEQDDGNDTDDLLRMLGEDNNKTKKKLTKTVKDIRKAIKSEVSSDDDDDFVYEGASKKLKLAKALTKKPLKAEPEDTADTDPSSDEVSTMKKMFNAKSQKASKTSEKKYHSQTKNVVNVIERPKKDKLTTSTPLRSQPRSLLKPTTPRALAAELKPPAFSSVEVKKEPNPNTYSRLKQSRPLPSAAKSSSILKPVVKEVVNEEFLDDEEFHLDEDEFESDYEDGLGSSRQRILRPERMDEEALSDADTHSEDGSLYDELPSSESEDMEDWFQLDIRAEKAGDYLPLLGAKAKEYLLEEKRRVSARITNLKQSLSALTDSGKKQAEQVRTATMALAELDDMLKAS